MKEKCIDKFGCAYSKAMSQTYPRICIKCGHPEEINAIDVEYSRLSRTSISTTGELAIVLRFLNQRDLLVQRFQEYPSSRFPIEEIQFLNQQIKSILNL